MPKKPTICVCERGGEEVFKAIKRQLKEQGVKDDVKLESEKCMKLCKTGSTVIVEPGSTEYGGVMEADAAELVRVVAAGGESIERLLAKNQKKKG